jgi:CheY-like chemotaxis protein
LTDPALLQRVVMNLGHNALRYTNQGAVMIVCRKVQNGTGVRIDVMDSGRGIAPAHQQHIFQEFYRVDGESADVSKGMGLGLHIVARTTEVLGAGLAVRSALGCGARFSVTLPIARPRPAIAQPERGLGAGARYADLQGIHVVVLEPDEQVRAALEGLLLSWGCAVFAAAALEPALQRLQDGDFAPSALVCDIALARPPGVDAEQDGLFPSPDLGAVGVLRRCMGVQIPACLFDGPGEAALRAQWQEQGVVVLDKPVRPAKLRAWLRRLRAGDPAAD